MNEAISKAQQEMSQREMAKRDLDPFVRLKRYFMNKWHNTGINGLKNKKIEIERYKEIIRDSVKESKLTSPELKDFLKKEMGFNPKLQVIKPDEKNRNAFGYDDETDKKFMMIDKDNIRNTTSSAGLIFYDNNEIKDIIAKFIIGHEYGHLYDFMKRYIETGIKMTVPTMARTPEEYDATKKSEARASKFSIYNMYRKDRWELLKRIVEMINPNDSNEDIEEYLKELGVELEGNKEEKDNNINILRAYINGLKDDDEDDIRIKRYNKKEEIEKEKKDRPNDYIFKKEEIEKKKKLMNDKLLKKFSTLIKLRS